MFVGRQGPTSRRPFRTPSSLAYAPPLPCKANCALQLGPVEDVHGTIRTSARHVALQDPHTCTVVPMYTCTVSRTYNMYLISHGNMLHQLEVVRVPLCEQGTRVPYGTTVLH
jgi:hypothetical protein